MKPSWFISFHAIVTCSVSCSTVLAGDKTVLEHIPFGALTTYSIKSVIKLPGMKGETYL
jgi:hypothetical protein